MNNLHRILNLIKKTGDKMIISDNDPSRGLESGQDFVIMPLSEYEKMVNNKSDYRHMSEKELLDSVERDISLWRAEHDDGLDIPFPAQGGLGEPEPWEMEHKPLTFDDEEELFGNSDEDGKMDFDDFDESDLEESESEKRSKFSIPDKKFDHQDIGEPVKYEDIPPPPSVNITDIMEDDENNENPIIDMSFDEDENENVENAEESSEFMTEPF